MTSLLKKYYEEHNILPLGLESRAAGVYVGVKLNDRSIGRILEFVRRNNIPRINIPKPVQAKDLHITLIYSKKPAKVTVRPNINEEVTVKGLRLFGEDKNVLVLLLDSEYLVNRHKELMDTYSLTYDYPVYTPHITISYNYPHKNLNLKGLHEIGKLRIVSEYTEDLNDLTSYE